MQMQLAGLILHNAMLCYAMLRYAVGFRPTDQRNQLTVQSLNHFHLLVAEPPLDD